MEKAIKFWLGDYDPVADGEEGAVNVSAPLAEIETLRETMLRRVAERACDGELDAIDWLRERNLIDMPVGYEDYEEGNEHQCPAPNINLVPAGTLDDETPKGE